MKSGEFSENNNSLKRGGEIEQLVKCKTMAVLAGIALVIIGAAGLASAEKESVTFGSLVMLTGFLATPGMDMQSDEEIRWMVYQNGKLIPYDLSQ